MTRRGWIALGSVSVVGVALAIALVFSLASDSEETGQERSEPTGRPGPPTGAPDPEAMQEFQACLEENGVEMPGPGEQPQGGRDSGDPGEPSQEQQNAFEECGDLLPEGGPGAPGGMPPGGPPSGDGLAPPG